jgi:hypothetical protein
VITWLQTHKNKDLSVEEEVSDTRNRQWEGEGGCREKKKLTCVGNLVS